ncbi:hypothetical protein HAALTHF_15450n [Vreelandella aquamarina]|nr:hypothetical protein HAALTHF_15450n [Halomonas axialensis]
MQQQDVDIVIVGGGRGLRAAIAAAEQAKQSGHAQRIALVSKVYPMRSHTVAAEGGAAAVTSDEDSFQAHFDDTVSGGDWLVEQGVVDYFVRHAYQELVQMERWGCPWSRQPDGRIQVRRFGGMKTARTWFAADKTGFHMLHTLFQTSLKYPEIERFDEYFVLDLAVHEGAVVGVIALQVATGELLLLRAKAVVLATGGAGRLFRFNTNAGIVTGDGMAMAYRHGVALRDMEFVQYHPTGLPGSGILITEACRGEGGILLNKEGYRYLQDYGLGPETPWASRKTSTWSWGLGTSSPRRSGRSSRPDAPASLATATWSISTFATWVPTIYMSACRSSASWPNLISMSTPSRSRSRFGLRCTTLWAASKPIPSAKPPSRGCTPPGSVPR